MKIFLKVILTIVVFFLGVFALAFLTKITETQGGGVLGFIPALLMIAGIKLIWFYKKNTDKSKSTTINNLMSPETVFKVSALIKHFNGNMKEVDTYLIQNTTFFADEIGSIIKGKKLESLKLEMQSSSAGNYDEFHKVYADNFVGFSVKEIEQKLNHYTLDKKKDALFWGFNISVQYSSGKKTSRINS